MPAAREREDGRGDGSVAASGAARWRRRLTVAAHSRLGIDARSLAAFRVALGLLVLSDLLLRSRNLRAFYTDRGVLPRSAVAAAGDSLRWSVHLLSGEAWFQALLFALAGLLAVALTVGYRTRLATVGSWLLLVSLHNRAPEVLNGGDFLLRLLLFWGIFLPLGARWAVDARHRDRPPRSRVVGVASAALLVQVVAVYLTNAAFKLSGDVWLRGDGLEYVFSLGQFTILLGDHLRGVPWLLSALDYVWLALVAGTVLLVLLRGPLRTAYAFALMGAHGTMLVTMRIDLFPLISVASLVPFLPAWFWDRLGPRLRGRRPARVAARLLSRLAARLPTVGTGPSRVGRRTRRLVAVVPLAFLALVVLWNVQYLGHDLAGHDVVPEEGEAAVQVTRTDQYWNMFAPDPLSTDGWVVAPGVLEDGSRVDAFHGGTPRWDRPPDVSATYPTARWRKYLVGLWRSNTADRRHFADYLCRRYNARHETRLETVDVYFVEQPTRLDGPEPTERVRLVRYYC